MYWMPATIFFQILTGGAQMALRCARLPLCANPESGIHAQYMYVSAVMITVSARMSMNVTMRERVDGESRGTTPNAQL